MGSGGLLGEVHTEIDGTFGTDPDFRFVRVRSPALSRGRKEGSDGLKVYKPEKNRISIGGLPGLAE